MSLDDVSDAALHRALDYAATNLDGTPCAPSTTRRKRAALSKIFTAASKSKERWLDVNRLRRVGSDVGTEGDTVVAIDPIMVAEAVDCLDILSRVPNRTYRLSLELTFYACLRPEEVAGLRVTDCFLPADGTRAELHLRKAESQVEKRYSKTKTPTTSDHRQLKHRRRGQVRVVPISPVLADLLRAAIVGKSLDDRVVATSAGTAPSLRRISGAFKWARNEWAEAQEREVPDRQVPHPYALRHAAATLWLKAGMPLQDVSKRLGNSPAVVLKTYANTIHGAGESYSAAVDRALEA